MFCLTPLMARTRGVPPWKQVSSGVVRPDLFRGRGLPSSEAIGGGGARGASHRHPSGMRCASPFQIAPGEELGRVLINRQPNANLDAPPDFRYWG